MKLAPMWHWSPPLKNADKQKLPVLAQKFFVKKKPCRNGFLAISATLRAFSYRVPKLDQNRLSVKRASSRSECYVYGIQRTTANGRNNPYHPSFCRCSFLAVVGCSRLVVSP